MTTRTLSMTAQAVLVIGALIASSFAFTSSAEAHWWPWHPKHAHGQEETVDVTIVKYIDGEMATAENADGLSFPMTATWNNPEGSDEGSGTYELAAGGDAPYQAMTAEMEAGSSYSTSELLDGDTVAATCSEDMPFKLAGYSTGDSLGAAAAADVSTNAPALSDITEDQYIIVWNESCDDEPTDPGDVDGDISGEVTGGQTEDDPGELAVTSIDAEKTTAIANGEFADGWRYVFNITVPSDETNLAMKFDDWLSSDGEHSIAVANNMRISSAQADNDGATILLTGADIYSSPALHMTDDLDSETDGLQVQVVVEVAIPSDTYNGTYSTNYGVQTLE